MGLGTVLGKNSFLKTDLVYFSNFASVTPNNLSVRFKYSSFTERELVPDFFTVVVGRLTDFDDSFLGAVPFFIKEIKYKLKFNTYGSLFEPICFDITLQIKSLKRILVNPRKIVNRAFIVQGQSNIIISADLIDAVSFSLLLIYFNQYLPPDPTLIVS